jgi:hypothetical protein
MSETWTQDDELQLAAMLHRKNEVVAKRRTELNSVLYKLSLDAMDGIVDRNGLTDELIKHADAITNALKPFTRREVGHAVKYNLPTLEASDGQN